MSDWRGARNILAVRLDNSGDVIMLGPALRAVKETSPAARVTLLCTPAGAAAAPLLPWVDEVLIWRPIWQDLGHLPFDPPREQELIAMLAAGRYDAALVFTSFSQTPHVAGYVCYLAGIPLRAGESKEFGGRCLTQTLAPAPEELHQVERNLRLVEALGFAVRERRLVIEIPPEARIAARRLSRATGIANDTPFVVVHPGASARARRPPPELIGAAARLLGERGWPVLVTGVPREAEAVDGVLREAPEARPLLGDATLPEYAALIEAAALVICGNTLPMHLADATGTPVVALYAGTDYEGQWQPRSTRARLLRRPTACAPCYLFDCPIGLPCLAIEPEEVVAAAVELLARDRATVVSRDGQDL